MYHLSGGNNKIEFVTNIFLNSDTDSQEVNHWKDKLISILQNVPLKADSLKPLIQFLVVTLEPSKIYLLQHNDISGTPPDRYFDLLIVMPGTAPSFSELEPILDIAYLKNKRVCCSLHNEGCVIEGLKNGHPFYCLNFIPGNIVYDGHETTYPVTTPEQFALIQQAAMETFMKGFEKAKSFYSCAEREFNNGSYELTLFMLHQVVELTCRTVLQSLHGRNLKGHEIRMLEKHIRRPAPELVSIFNEDTEQEKRLLDTLEKGYIDARYNNEFKVDKTILSLLFERVKLFQVTAYEVIKMKTGRD